MLFKEVLGQDSIKQKLIQEIKNEKISHAQLFAGLPGNGGLALALAFVQYLFCEQKKEDDSCGECPSCIKIQKLEHPDLHFTFPTVLADHKLSDPLLGKWREQIKENVYFDLNDWIKKIDPKSERTPVIGSEQSVEFIKKLSLKSYEGGYKVMIVWMAEQLNVFSSNKLLKIIEEPQAKTIIILLSNSTDSLLPTILSRTQLVKIPKIEQAILIEHLKSNYQVNLEIATSILSRSDGDLIEAIRLVQSSEDNEDNRTHFIQLMRVCYKKDVLLMMEWIEETSSLSKPKIKNFLLYALHMFRQSILKNYTDDMLISVSIEEKDFLTNFAKFITGNNIFDFMKLFNDAHYHVDRNANTKILLNDLCFNVMRYIHKA